MILCTKRFKQIPISKRQVFSGFSLRARYYCNHCVANIATVELTTSTQSSQSRGYSRLAVVVLKASRCRGFASWFCTSPLDFVPVTGSLKERSATVVQMHKVVSRYPLQKGRTELHRPVGHACVLWETIHWRHCEFEILTPLVFLGGVWLRLTMIRLCWWAGVEGSSLGLMVVMVVMGG